MMMWRSWIARRVRDEDKASLRKRVVKILSLVGVGIGLAILFKWVWGDVVDRETVEKWLVETKQLPFAPLLLICIFVIAGMLGISLNLLLVVSVVVFGPIVTFLCGYAGAHLSALAGFTFGRKFGTPLLEKRFADSLERLGDHLQRRGIVSVAVLRILPVAPFPVVNVAAGASKVSWSHFNWGTLAGMFPGMLAVVILTYQLDEAISNPGWQSFLWLAAVATIIAVCIVAVWKTLSSRNSKHGAES